jgi:hypothetical protein
MAKDKLSTGCSDWQLRWSGYVGKLTLNPLTNEFTWKGRWHGRHGQQSIIVQSTFTYNDGKINIIKRTGNGKPVDSELIKACEIILQAQM